MLKLPNIQSLDAKIDAFSTTGSATLRKTINTSVADPNDFWSDPDPT